MRRTWPLEGFLPWPPAPGIEGGSRVPAGVAAAFARRSILLWTSYMNRPIAQVMMPTQPGNASKHAANRANARNSTEPRTAAGKARVARDACRHGISRPVGRDSALAAEVVVMARAILADTSPSSGRAGWG